MTEARGVGSMDRDEEDPSVEEHIVGAYYRMAREARHRPYAASDELEALSFVDEALSYAADWCAAEDEAEFVIGCCDWETRPAMIFAVEACRLMCMGFGAFGPHQVAHKLLRMALADLEQVMEHNQAS